MKTLRITAALLIALAAAACSSSPTAPAVEAPTTATRMDGTGYMGGGTR
jgi:ABC-type glycerol-3-phosphate transport system substrate-binding protein